ncbi:uncharacterized protein METZ01_LOCUS482953, partial [marine metagenome]
RRTCSSRTRPRTAPSCSCRRFS